MGIIDKLVGGDYEARSATRQSQETMDILKQQYPELMSLLGDQNKTAALQDLELAKQVTPAYNDLALGELSRLQPQMTDVQRRMDAGQAASDVENLGKYGADASRALRTTDEAANKEFYDNLVKASAKTGELLSGLSPNLSAGKRAEVERGVGRLGGADNSAVTTAQKAMEFGSAHDANMNNFANILNGITANLGNLKTGVNGAGVALGRDSRSAPVAAAVTPVNKPQTAAADMLGNMYNQSFGAVQGHDATNARMFKSWGDVLGQTAGTIGNMAGAASSWNSIK